MDTALNTLYKKATREKHFLSKDSDVRLKLLLIVALVNVRFKEKIIDSYD